MATPALPGTLAFAIEALDSRLVKQGALIAKASAACALELEDDRDIGLSQAADPVTDIPSAVASARLRRQAVEFAATSKTTKATSYSEGATQTDEAAGTGREAELEAEIDRLKQRHRQQLLAAERDLARFRARAKSTSPAVESHDGASA